jgi:hypothetical protein
MLSRSCHHGIAHLQVADGGETFQMLKVGVTIVNTQLRTADKGWSSSMGMDFGLTTPHGKYQNVLKCYIRSENAKETNNLEDLNADGLILEWIFEEAG